MIKIRSKIVGDTLEIVAENNAPKEWPIEKKMALDIAKNIFGEIPIEMLYATDEVKEYLGKYAFSEKDVEEIFAEVFGGAQEIFNLISSNNDDAVYEAFEIIAENNAPEEWPLDKKMALDIAKNIFAEIPIEMLDATDELKEYLVKYGFSEKDVEEIFAEVFSDAQEIFNFVSSKKAAAVRYAPPQ